MPDLITLDIENFWRAFDTAEGMPVENQVRIYEDLYLNRGSRGFREFATSTLADSEAFAAFVVRHDTFYRSVRFQIYRLREFEGEIRHFYRRLKRLYPPIAIPNIYCVMGRLSCLTMGIDSGILLAAEAFGLTDRTMSEDLTPEEARFLRPMALLPDAVIHEVVHRQARVAANETESLLTRSVREGLAVLVTEHVTGRKDESAPHIYGDAHEREVWAAFRGAMRGTDASGWLGPSPGDQNRPANIGGYVGCQICRAFVRDVPQGEIVRTLIEVEDYEDLFEKSGYEGFSNGT